MASGSMPCFNLLKFLFLSVFLLADEAKLQNITYDLVFRFPHKNVSLKALLEVQSKTPEWSTAQWHTMIGYNCKGRCNKRDQRYFFHTYKCYCDEICLALGDCCYDYLSSCKPSTREYWSNDHPSIYRCIEDVLVISKCPKNYHNQTISRKCMSRASLVEKIPFFDNTTKASYQNMFCAKCHNATAKFLSFWKFEPQCQKYKNQTNNTNTWGTIPSNATFCHIFVLPDKMQKNFSSKCISSRDPCLIRQVVDPFGYDKESEYWANKVCGLYKMPFETTRNNWENPHCSLCNEECVNTCKKRLLNNDNFVYLTTIEVPLNSLDKSSKELARVMQNKAAMRFNLVSIFSLDYEYRPKFNLLDEPVNVYGKFLLSTKDDKKRKNRVEGTGNDTTALQSLPLNCSKTMIVNISYVVFYPNLSIFLPFLGKMYSNGSYNRRQLGVEVCFKKNKKDNGKPYVEEPSSASFTDLQILTFAGFALSFLAEIALLVIYFVLKALRNKPGKILMSLMTCLIVYQVLFLMVMLELAYEIRWMCVSIAVLFHYFLLVCFAWMSVMAFDVMKTFVLETARAPSGSLTFRKYCCYAYGLPMLIVLTSFILDITDTVIFGYGTRGCLWRPDIIPALLTLHVPVGLLIVLDLIAITLTVRAIRSAKEASRMARAPGHQAITTPLLCIKMVFAMGVTWVLGLVVAFVDSPPLMYIYVIMNSLQGFFIGVLFLTSKRTIKLIKEKSKPKNPKNAAGARGLTRVTKV